MRRKKAIIDVRFENHGSVVLVRPLTDRGMAWIAANVVTEGWQWLGRALACEPRYVENLACGMGEDGLEVSYA